MNTFYEYMLRGSMPEAQSFGPTVVLSNILLFDEEIDSIESYIRRQIDTKISEVDAVLLRIIVPYMAIILLMRALIAFLFYQFSQFRYRVVALILQVKRVHYEEYFSQLAQLLSRIEEGAIRFVQNYHFDIVATDQQIYAHALEMKEGHGKPKVAAAARNQRNFAEPRFQVIEWKTYLYMLFSMLVFLAVMLVTYAQFTRFQDTFKSVSYVYQTFCNSQMYTTQLVIYREYLYYYLDSLPYLRQVLKREDFSAQIEDSLHRYQHFVSVDLQKDYGYMNSARFTHLLTEVQSTNICTDILHLDDNNIQRALTSCQSILGGALTQGLTIALQRLIQEFKDEFDSTRFSQGFRQPNFITEAQLAQFSSITYTSDVIRRLSEAIKQSMQELTNRIILNNDIVLYLYLCYIVGLYILIQSAANRRLFSQLIADKNILMIIPQQTYIVNTFLQAEVNLMLKRQNFTRT